MLQGINILNTEINVLSIEKQKNSQTTFSESYFCEIAIQLEPEALFCFQDLN